MLNSRLQTALWYHNTAVYPERKTQGGDINCITIGADESCRITSSYEL
jgi:hypothetical protein